MRNRFFTIDDVRRYRSDLLSPSVESSTSFTFCRCRVCRAYADLQNGACTVCRGFAQVVSTPIDGGVRYHDRDDPSNVWYSAEAVNEA